MRRALVVDDEPEISRVVTAYLERAGFGVVSVADGSSALAEARAAHFDVVVLDLMLPDIDGVEVCRRLRTFSDAYVVMLTARVEEIDEIVGLSVGADDYVTKPFSPRVLLARIESVLRRPRSTLEGGAGSGGPLADASVTPAVRRFGDLTVDVGARDVTVAGRVVELTRTEFDLLDAMSARPRQVFSRRALVEAVWGADWLSDDRSVDVHVSHLRAKLGDDPSNARFVLTVRGVGFRMGTG